jgi:hypothetical protein
VQVVASIKGSASTGHALTRALPTFTGHSLRLSTPWNSGLTYAVTNWPVCRVMFKATATIDGQLVDRKHLVRPGKAVDLM